MSCDLWSLKDNFSKEIKTATLSSFNASVATRKAFLPDSLEAEGEDLVASSAFHESQNKSS